MMALALASFLSMRRHRFVLGGLLLFGSILIKGATLILVPVFFRYLYVAWKKRTLQWQQVWYWGAVSMYVIFFLSPLREEIYAWYFIWPLTFLALMDKPSVLQTISYGFSLGLMLRIVPFLYTRSWAGITPMVKKVATFVPPFLAGLHHYAKASRS